VRADRPVDGLSKLNSVRHLEVDVISRRAEDSDDPKAIDELDACGSKSSRIP
jgi:hypothetical protein